MTIVSVGGNSQRVAALQALGFPVLLSPEDMNPPYQHTSIVASKAFLAENRQTAVNFLKALPEAIFLMKQDREGTLTSPPKYCC